MVKQEESLDEFVRKLFLQIQTELPATVNVPADKLDRVSNELLYLSIFLIDLGVYLGMNGTPEHQLVMDSFWDLVNASGLNMDVVHVRLQAYAESAKGQTREQSLERLAKTFAWHCLAQGDSDMMAVGQTESRRILESVVQLASSTQIK